MNCIGYYNMRFFFHFVFYSFLNMSIFFGKYLLFRGYDPLVWWAKGYFILTNGYLCVILFIFSVTYAYLIYKGMTLVEKAKMLGGRFVKKIRKI